MDNKIIDHLVSLLEKSSTLVEIEYSAGNERIRLAKSSTPSAPLQTSGIQHLQSQQACAATEPTSPLSGTHVIAAGLSGLFYRAPNPKEPPFVQVGGVVSEGQTLGIIEAMKMLHPIEADRAGRIIRIAIDDGAAVEAGMDLFGIEPIEVQRV